MYATFHYACKGDPLWRRFSNHITYFLFLFLGKGRFMYTKSSVESFPVLSLRRKLFTQSESSSNGCPTASPLSAGSRESGPFSPSISPIKSSQECHSPTQHPHGPGTPNSIEVSACHVWMFCRLFIQSFFHYIFHCFIHLIIHSSLHSFIQFHS